MPSVVIKCINLTEREKRVEFMRNDEVHFEAANSLTAGEGFSHDSFRGGGQADLWVRSGLTCPWGIRFCDLHITIKSYAFKSLSYTIKSLSNNIRFCDLHITIKSYAFKSLSYTIKSLSYTIK